MTRAVDNAVVADVGGTNTRAALVSGGRLGPAQLLSNRTHSDIVDALEAVIARLGARERPRQAALGIAAPIRGDDVQLINIDWRFSIEALRKRLDLDRLIVVNDFTAVAWSLPLLGEGDRLQIGGGIPVVHAARGVLGPGTGLGVSGLLPCGTGWTAIAGEGGHATLPATTPREAAVIEAARERYGHCSAERLLSGPGLETLYEILARHEGRSEELAAADIARRATAGDALAREALLMFFELLGTVAADLALTLGAFGGIYIAGGIAPANRDLLFASGFRQRFEDKGRYREYLSRIPTYLITAEQPALLGLLALLQNP